MEVASVKKPNAIAAMLVSELLSDGKIYDDTAETVAEIAAKTGMSNKTTSEHITARVKSGQIEKVWKRSGYQGRPVPAYRVKLK